MSAATSPSTHQPYGVQRVCRIWAIPRSTFYQARRPADAAPAKPRGPRPPVDDASLLAAIQADLAASPISPPRRFPARGTARSGPACTTAWVCRSAATACCA